jgi:NADPH:quinone reductase-like Zn-dependent oxidoreductase
MKAAFIRRYGGNKVVELGELPAPQAGPGELLVAVHAASVNPVDFKIRDGMLKMIIPFGFPLILGNDLSGVVKAVGAGVTHFKPGDAVFARMDKRRIGAFAEFAVVAEADAAAKPANLSHIEAAAVPLAGLTAWQALFEIGGLKAGQKVLIHGGSGGVGSFAIQLARIMPARRSPPPSARATPSWCAAWAPTSSSTTRRSASRTSSAARTWSSTRRPATSSTVPSPC